MILMEKIEKNQHEHDSRHKKSHVSKIDKINYEKNVTF